MSFTKTKAAIIDALNRCMPAARDAKLGTKVDQLVAACNALQADAATHRTAYAALVTKLNADGGVTDTNYAAPAALTSAQVTDIGLA